MNIERNALKLLENDLLRPGNKSWVLKGARQVGKSTLVRNFAKKAQKRLIEVNLERERQLETACEPLWNKFQSFQGISLVRFNPHPTCSFSMRPKPSQAPFKPCATSTKNCQN